MNPLFRGIWSGLIATAQMTQFLQWGFRCLPSQERAPLPPATLTREAGRKAGLPAPAKNESENHTLAAHFLFGMSCATAYALLQSRRKEQDHPAAEGVLYGLMVWGGSYLAGIPAMGLRPSAYRMSLERNTLMIAAHLVWGACLGLAERDLRHRSHAFDGRRSFRPLPKRKEAS